jgi:hypothetical protein
MILLSAKRRSFAALESESCKSLLSCISLMKIYSICIYDIHYIYTPLSDILIDLLFNIIGYFLSFLKQILKDKLSASVFQDSVGNFCDGYVEILNAIVCISWIDNSEVNCSVDVDGDVIFCDDILNLILVTCLCKSNTFIFKLIIPKVSVQGLI